jgi:hypothetical protein
MRNCIQIQREIDDLSTLREGLMNHEIAEPSCLAVLVEGVTCPHKPGNNGYCAAHEWMADRDLEIFKILAEHFRQDLRLFWQRSNLYLVVQAALVSVFVAAQSGSFASPLCIFGLILCVFWYLVARGSILWISRWRRELIALDRVVDRFHIFLRLEEHVNSQPWLSPSWVTQWLPVAFAIGWLGLLISSLS